MSLLRPTLVKSEGTTPCPHGLVAYIAIYNSVKEQKAGLLHGKLEDGHGRYCAIGSYFRIKNRALPTDLLDEVAMVNDSCPLSSAKQRKNIVLKFLLAKMRGLGWK
jgi:hypothetical protein